MALLTVDECKELLGIADNSYDTKITALIPYIQQDIIDYCNNLFDDPSIHWTGSGSLAFVRGDTNTSSTSPDTITDELDIFSTIGFQAGMDIAVAGGSNQGVFTLASVTTDTLTLTSTGEIFDQDQDAVYNYPGSIYLTRVMWPKPLKILAAKMVWHLIDKARQGDIRSESVDDYSVTFAGEHAYPMAIIRGLAQYRRLYLV